MVLVLFHSIQYGILIFSTAHLQQPIYASTYYCPNDRFSCSCFAAAAALTLCTTHSIIMCNTCAQLPTERGECWRTCELLHQQKRALLAENHCDNEKLWESSDWRIFQGTFRMFFSLSKFLVSPFLSFSPEFLQLFTLFTYYADITITSLIKCETFIEQHLTSTHFSLFPRNPRDLLPVVVIAIIH